MYIQFLFFFKLYNILLFIFTLTQKKNVITIQEIENDNITLKNLINNEKNIRIRVGHIGVPNLMPKVKEILAIYHKELWKEGLLNDKFDIE